MQSRYNVINIFFYNEEGSNLRWWWCLNLDIWTLQEKISSHAPKMLNSLNRHHYHKYTKYKSNIVHIIYIFLHKTETIMCLQNYIYVIQKQQPTPGFLEKNMSLLFPLSILFWKKKTLVVIFSLRKENEM